VLLQRPKEAPAVAGTGADGQLALWIDAGVDQHAPETVRRAGRGADPKSFKARKSPRAMPRSLRTTRNQYMFCESAQRSLQPAQSRKA